MTADKPLVSTRRKEDDRKERDKKLDQAIEMTFSAATRLQWGARACAAGQREANESQTSAQEVRRAAGADLRG